MRYTNKIIKINFNKLIIIFLLLGTAIRIPVSSSANVSISELFLVFFLIFFPLYTKGKKNMRKLNFSNNFLIICYIVLILFLVQCIVNYTRIINICLIFEYLFIAIFFVFIFNKVDFSHNIYYISLLVFSYYLSLNNIYYNILGYSIGKTVNILKFGSSNYTSAVMLILIPIIYFYINKEINKRLNFFGYISIMLMILSIIFSGSRSNITIMLFQFIIYLFLQKNKFYSRFKILLLIIVIGYVGYNIVSHINPQLKFVIDRYMIFFTGDVSTRNDIVYSDLFRKQLKEEAKNIIIENKLFGIGFARLPNSDIPIHNFVYEIILSIGFVGFSVYIIYFFTIINETLRKVSNGVSEKILVITMILTFISICWFHPFMTTGKEYVFIFWLNIISFASFKYKKK